MARRIFVIENTALGEDRPLSIFLTGLLRDLPTSDKLEINLITSSSPALPLSLTKKFSKIYQVPTSLYSAVGNLRFAWSAFRILASENRSREIDVLHCLYPNSSLMAAALFKLFGNSSARVIYDLRSPWIDISFAMGHLPWPLTWLLKPIMLLSEWLLSFFVDHIVFISEGLRDFYRKKGLARAGTTTSVIPSAVDLTNFRRPQSKPLGERARATRIGYIGTLSRSRHLLNFLDMFKVASKQFDLRLDLVGQGDAREQLEAWVSSNDMGEKITVYGPIPHKEVSDKIQSFDFGLSHLPKTPVYDYSFPLKILEYLACGVPVLASATPAHEEISRKLGGVHIYADADDLTHHLSSAQRNITLDLSAYDFAATARQYADLYGKI